MDQIPYDVESAAAALRDGTCTSVELTQACLARADAFDEQVGTYLARFDESAMRAAATADAELAAGIDRGPMQGIPIGMKDILAMSEGPTTANSLVLDPAWGAGKDGPVVRRLKEAGAVITGKVVTSEFAIGSPDPSKPFPIPRNPWDLAATPGGSSAGTGNGIAGGFFLAGIGTDTGGSIRIPAAFNGTSGLMPTFGLVPKSGCVPLGFTLDHIGPLAHGAWDCAVMLQVIAGYDPSDPNCVDRPVPDFSADLEGGVDGLRIGVVHEGHFPEGSDPAVLGAFDDALAELASMGAELIEVNIPYYDEVTAACMITMLSEAYAYHRNDMVSRWADYYERTRGIVSWASLIQSHDYVQAQRVRRVGQEALAGVFAGVDVIATPTASIGAPLEVDFASSDEAFGDLMTKVHTFYWDAVGNPVLVVPMGFGDGGMPLSLQLAGRPFDEATLLRTGRAYQGATTWHTAVPELTPIAA
jgi:aspartyl-tRNA(Asn)/glutamyl-tRNA(Gln) amidotransferase subunit A